MNVATKTAPKSKTKKKVARHERCAICHYPFGTGTCDSCRDPKCDMCGLRLLTIERERGSKCTGCSPDAAKHAVRVAKQVEVAEKTLPKELRRSVAIVLTD